MSNYKFVVNPVSGRGRGYKTGQWLENHCIQKKLDFDLEYTKMPGHAAEISNRAAQKFEYIVSAGGDGTLQEVLNGCYDKNVKFGVIPVGTGNDFIKSLEIPNNPQIAFNIVQKGKLKVIDLGKAGNRIFHNGVGIGFDASVVQNSLKMKYIKGKALYFLAVLKTLLSLHQPQLEIIYENYRNKSKFLMISIGNGRYMGGGFKLTPFAEVADGLLDLTIISELSKLKVLQNLIGVYQAKHIYLPYVKTAKTKKLRIKSDEFFAAQADGELIGLNLKELEIEIIPQAIQIAVP